jgi:succinoglycan biosynthesis transport protein ExoP
VNNNIFPSGETAQLFESQQNSQQNTSRSDVESTPDLLVYWRAVLRWKFAILAFALGVGALVWLVTSLMAPKYTAMSKLMLDVNQIRTVSIDSLYDPNVARSIPFINTQLEIIRSPEVTTRVVDKLRLHVHPEFDPRQAKPGVFERAVRTFLPAADNQEEITDEQVRRYLAKVLASNTRTTLQDQSLIVEIRHTSPDAVMSSRIADELAKALIENDLESKFQMTQQATGWMNERLVQLKTDLGESERKLQQFRDSRGLVNTQGVVASAAAQLTGTTAQMIDAKAQRARLQSSYNRVQNLMNTGGNLSEEPLIARSASVIAARGALQEAERALSQAKERYGPQHPVYKQAEAQFNAASVTFEKETNVVAGQILRDFESADATVRAIEQTVSSARSQVASVNRSEFELSSLEREVENNRQLYDLFLNRIKETGATDGLRQTIGRLVEPASAASKTFPQPLAYSLLAFFVALFAGVAAAILAVLVDSTVKSTEEVESRLGSAVLGSVPKSKLSGRGIAKIQTDPWGLFAESFRTIRTAVTLSEVDEDKVVVAITSSIPGEGKSTVSANFALVQSQTKKTLLIDADMRRPTLGKDLVKNFDKSFLGLSDLVAGLADFDKVIHKVEDTELYFISSGTAVPNPLDLLSSKRFQALLEELKSRFEVVVVDTPPVRLVSDAAVISELCTGVIYVVQSDSTPYKLAQRGIADIRKSGTKLLGVVLNKHNIERADRYYGEYSGYGGIGYQSYYGADRMKKA